MMRAIWIHQFDRARLASIEELSAQWPGAVYVKALDGRSWMADFDASPLAVSGPTGSEGRWTWSDLAAPQPVENGRAWGWAVPTGVAAGEEGELTAEVANAAGGVILDLEPYEQFWRGDRVDAERFTRAYQAHSAAPIGLSIDYRRLPFPHPVFHELATRYLPQCYWTAFRRPWREVLEECALCLADYAKPIEYVLPGDADRADLKAALGWCADRGADASIWVWQTIREENWDLLREWQKIAVGGPEPPEPPGSEEMADLVNLLGYLQGDVALAIRSPLQRLKERTRARRSRALINEALAAVTTLEREGRA